jgi:hypothetical protein
MAKNRNRELFDFVQRKCEGFYGFQQGQEAVEGLLHSRLRQWVTENDRLIEIRSEPIELL